MSGIYFPSRPLVAKESGKCTCFLLFYFIYFNLFYFLKILFIFREEKGGRK